MELGKEDEEVAEVDEQCYENTVFIGEGGRGGIPLLYTDAILGCPSSVGELRWVWYIVCIACVLTRHYCIVDFRCVRKFRGVYRKFMVCTAHRLQSKTLPKHKFPPYMQHEMLKHT